MQIMASKLAILTEIFSVILNKFQNSAPNYLPIHFSVITLSLDTMSYYQHDCTIHTWNKYTKMKNYPLITENIKPHTHKLNRWGQYFRKLSKAEVQRMPVGAVCTLVWTAPLQSHFSQNRQDKCHIHHYYTWTLSLLLQQFHYNNLQS
jgi:hypothetical protein